MRGCRPNTALQAQVAQQGAELAAALERLAELERRTVGRRDS